MEWDATLGGMLKHGTLVYQTCLVCGVHRPIDVPAMISRLSTKWSLWDDFGDCPDACGGVTFYSATTGKGTPLRPLKNYMVMPPRPGADPDDWCVLPMWPGLP